jgi:hypothetical protein
MKLPQAKTSGQFFAGLLIAQSTIIILWIFSELGGSDVTRIIVAIVLLGSSLLGLGLGFSGLTPDPDEAAANAARAELDAMG